MNKILGIIIPYFIIAFVGGMNYVGLDEALMIETIVIGLLIGIWMLAIMRAEGTTNMKIMIFVNTVIMVVLSLVGVFYFFDDTLLKSLGLISLLLLPIQLVSDYIVIKNKPRLSMSYRYSFKNRRKRYF